jgi:hypothetical protein
VHMRMVLHRAAPESALAALYALSISHDLAE